jgi:type IV secretion system protein VirB6
MAFVDVLNTVFSDLDTVGTSTVQSLYTSIGGALQPVFTVGLSIYVVYYGYEIAFGRATMAATDFVWRLTRIALIYGLAFGWGDFQTIVVNVLSQTTDSMAGSICTAVASGVGGGSYCPSGSGSSATVVASSLNGIWASGATAAQSISAAGGTFGVGLMFAGLLVLVLTGLFIVEAMFMVVMGKLALFVLLGLAPIFIALALFNVSSMLFTGWIRSCLTFSIVPLLTYGFLGFFEGLITGQMSSLNAAASGQTVSVGTVAPFVALCAMGALLMTQIPAIASGLAGGPAFRHPSAVSFAEGFLMAGAARGAARGGAALVGGAGRAASGAGAATMRALRGSNSPGMSAGLNAMSGGSAVAAQVAAGLKDARK